MEKDYIVLLHNLDAGSSALLGSFNSEDKYDIEDNIKQELVKANKLITEYKNTEVKATAKVGEYSFDFVVYVQLGEEHKKRLSLILKEKCKLGFVEQELETVVASVIVEENINLLEELKKQFNMYTIDESTGVDMSNLNLKEIIEKKQKVSNRAKFLLTELKGVNKAYVTKMLSLIKNSGPYGNQLLLQFKEIIKSQNLDKSKDNYWLTLKTLLDKLIADNSMLFDDKTKQKMAILQKEYMSVVLNTKEPAPTLNKSAKKGGKKSPKKKKKGGAKKDDKKKDAGKKSSKKPNPVKAEPTKTTKTNFQEEKKVGIIKNREKFGDLLGRVYKEGNPEHKKNKKNIFKYIFSKVRIKSNNQKNVTNNATINQNSAGLNNFNQKNFTQTSTITRTHNDGGRSL